MQNSKCKECKMRLHFAFCILHYSLVRKHPLQLGVVLIGHLLGAALVALGLRCLARQDVALEGTGSDDLSRSRLLEALGGASMCFQFRHLSTRLSFPARPSLRPSLSGHSCGQSAGSG